MAFAGLAAICIKTAFSALEIGGETVAELHLCRRCGQDALNHPLQIRSLVTRSYLKVGKIGMDGQGESLTEHYGEKR